MSLLQKYIIGNNVLVIKIVIIIDIIVIISITKPQKLVLAL